MTELFYQHLKKTLKDIQDKRALASRHMKEIQESEDSTAEEDAIFNERHGEYYALYHCEDLVRSLINCARIEMGKRGDDE